MIGLRIGQLNATYLVPQNHPAPDVVRSKLDAIASRELGTACARALSLLCHDDDPSIWFIRRLAVDAAVDAGWEGDRLGEAWAAQLTGSLVRQMSRGDEGEGDVVRFPSHAAWLAQFFRDLADGVAWSKWYYARLEGLRALPLHAALREALCREPIEGEAALRQLAVDGRIEKVLSTLTEPDCRAVLEAFCREERESNPTEPPATRLQSAWRSWQRAPLNAGVPVATHHTALKLYLAMRDDGVASCPALPQTLQALLSLIGWMGSPQAGLFLAALQRADSAALFQLSRGDDPDSLAALLRHDSGSVLEIAEQLGRARGSPTSEKESTETRRRFTPFGGVFYLLPRLSELGLEECAAALPFLDETTPEALARFLVLLKCLGAKRAPRAFFDPVLRELAGVPSDLSAETVRAWGSSVTNQVARDFQVRWAAGCWQRGLIDGRWLCLRSARRGRLLLLSAGERDLYLQVGTSAHELVEMLQGQPLATAHVEGVLCDPSLVRTLPATIVGCAVRDWNSSEGAGSSSTDAARATCLKHAASPDNELNYFNLPSLLRGARALDLALTVAARAMLRNFAWRLPGFAWSGAEYLFTNFLNVSATIQSETGHWLARLGKPPLQIVLAMTGAAQGACRIPWLSEQEIQLISES